LVELPPSSFYSPAAAAAAGSARDDADPAEDETGPMPLTNAVPACDSLLSSYGYLRISSP